MQSVEIFDVVIIYDGLVAKAASDTQYTGRLPFPTGGKTYSWNKTYEYFLDHCKQQGLRAGFASTKDITPQGLLKSVWVFNKQWKRVRKVSEATIIFDKFSNLETYNAKYLAKLKNNAKGVTFFHNEDIRDVFDNKLKTYTEFARYAIPTAKINVKTAKGVADAKSILLGQINKHKHTADFSTSFVLKDQFGSGGTNVFKVSADRKLAPIGKRDVSISYVLQPFIAASGFEFADHEGNIDLRVIVCNGEIMQCYIRIPKTGEFRANASYGGEVVYLAKKNIPLDVLAMSKAINMLLPIQDGFYALDYIKSSTGHLYFIEGNSTPGLIWFNKEDEYFAKQLMRSIIKKMKQIIRSQRKSKTKLNVS